MVPITSRDDSDDNGAASATGIGDSSNGLPARRRRYRMTTELAVMNGDFFVLNDAGEHVYRFSSRSIANDDRIRIEDLRGRTLFEAPARSAQKKTRIAVFDPAGNEIAAVIRRQISPLLDRFVIELSDGQTLLVEGNISTHEFSVAGQQGSIAEVSRKWFKARGSYGVEIFSEHLDALWLSIVAVLDQMVGASE